jgi:kumamolisin
MTTVAKNLDDQITISIYLKRDLHENGMTLEEYADGVIAGTHEILGHDEFVYQFGATDDNLTKAVDWATSHGLTVLDACRGKSFITVLGPVGRFNTLLNIIIQDITDDTRTYMYYPDNNVIVPDDISDAIESIAGFDQSFVAVKHAVEADLTDPELVKSLVAVNPIQVSTAYNSPVGDGYGGCIGLFELSLDPSSNPGYDEGWQQPDVTASFSRIGLTAPTITTINVGNAYFSPTSTGESMLDIYCAGGAAPKAKIAYYIAPNSGTTNINNCILAAANDTTNNPSVLSISWGIGDGAQYDSAFQACIVKGITCFVSSGDSGAVNLSMAQTCCSRYAVIVGGTSLVLNGSNQITSEVAWSGSGGGISGAVSLPSWQTGLTVTTLTASAFGSPSALGHRGVPDMSAPGDPATGWSFYSGGDFVVRGSLATYGGTSASAPFIAGTWVRLNQLLGYRIPFNLATFYNFATSQSGTVPSLNMFNDIISGNNRNGYTTGYTTTVGWDPVTGLGSPNVDAIYKYFHTGSTFPKQNYGFRPASGIGYPRRTTGAR